jgi:hypothetical protein
MNIVNVFNFALFHPEKIKIWHPTKNGALKPNQVYPYSNKKVWWRCAKGHEWQATVNNIARSTQYGCPYCSGKKASVEKSLAVLHPKTAQFWHPVKNGDLTPQKVLASSRKRVWWQCDKGHGWQAVIGDRSRAKFGNCPYCSGRKASPEYNLAIKNKKLANEWHRKKNRGLTPEEVTPFSRKVVWWQCKKGHEWKTAIQSRNKRGKQVTGCPFCKRKYIKKTSADYNLAVINPQLAKLWHPHKNRSLKPNSVFPRASRKVWWRCDNGHEWLAPINRVAHSAQKGCPFCAGKQVSNEKSLASVRPDLAKLWHPTKNGTLTPQKILPGSGKRIWWQCKKGHEWFAVVCDRSGLKVANCPFCSKQRASPEYNLSTEKPKLAKEWHPTKNNGLTPEDVTPYSERKVWWQCSKGHEWQIAISSRTGSKNGNCPYCIGRRASPEYNLAVKNPELASEWHPTSNGRLTPKDVTPHSREKVWWRCKYKHEWEAEIRMRNKTNYAGTKCPYCSGHVSMKKIRF